MPGKYTQEGGQHPELTVYLQRGSGNSELIFQTARGCQVYRPWPMPGEDETGRLRSHLLPQTHWGPVATLGLVSVPHTTRETWKAPMAMGFLTGPGAPCPASLCDLVLFRVELWSENTGLLFVVPAQWSHGVQQKWVWVGGTSSEFSVLFPCYHLPLTSLPSFQSRCFPGRWG